MTLWEDEEARFGYYMMGEYGQIPPSSRNLHEKYSNLGSSASEDKSHDCRVAYGCATNSIGEDDGPSF